MMAAASDSTRGNCLPPRCLHRQPALGNDVSPEPEPLDALRADAELAARRHWRDLKWWLRKWPGVQLVKLLLGGTVSAELLWAAFPYAAAAAATVCRGRLTTRRDPTHLSFEAFPQRLLQLLDEGRFVAHLTSQCCSGCLMSPSRRSAITVKRLSTVSTQELTVKVVEIYWPHTLEFDDEVGRLRQNQRGQARSSA